MLLSLRDYSRFETWISFDEPCVKKPLDIQSKQHQSTLGPVRAGVAIAITTVLATLDVVFDD